MFHSVYRYARVVVENGASYPVQEGSEKVVDSNIDNVVAVRLVACLFFFFQAEDGIRDLTVTGVQTCALPICRRRIRASAGSASTSRAPTRNASLHWLTPRGSAACIAPTTPANPGGGSIRINEIGRASCRGRV